MRDRTAWTRVTEDSGVVRGRKYRDLVQFTRKCKSCGKPFSIYVTPRIASGDADSNQFGMANCEEHRGGRNSPGQAEIDRLRNQNALMKEELDGAYARIKDLQARLSRYELAPAMQKVAEKFPWA